MKQYIEDKVWEIRKKVEFWSRLGVYLNAPQMIVTSVFFCLLQRLNEVSPQLTKEQCEAALMEGNRKKNRKCEIYPST